MDQPRCPFCQTVMADGTEHCATCDKKVIPEFTPDAVEGEKGLYYCYRHKKETTRLCCGRCGRAICTNCASIGHAGARCPDCARNKIPVRPRAIAHEAKKTFSFIFFSPRNIWIFIIFAGLMFTIYRSCSRPEPTNDSNYYDSTQEDPSLPDQD